MSVLVMTSNGTLGHGLGSTITGGTFTIITTPKTKGKVNGAGIFSGTLQYSFAGGSAPGMVAGTVATTAPQSINPTAVKSRVQGDLVVREGDSGTMQAEGTLTGGGVGPVSGPVEVNDAGQNVLRGK